ncbi:hypothetical protein FJ365_05880 [Candidatus Dependentiae bacterium]|nr:hypothetical protein [Candidatus Dependentiae bacterium]
MIVTTPFIVRYIPHKFNLIFWFVMILLASVLIVSGVDRYSGFFFLILGLWYLATELHAFNQQPEKRKILLELNCDLMRKRTFFWYRTVRWEDVVEVKRHRVSDGDFFAEGWLFVRAFPYFNVFISDTFHGLTRMTFAKKIKMYYKGPLLPL